jgi:hypothetical protein
VTRAMLQAVLASGVHVELPAFLLVSFMVSAAPEAPRLVASARIVCAASAAAVLRGLISAGKLRMACRMIEEYVHECVSAASLMLFGFPYSRVQRHVQMCWHAPRWHVQLQHVQMCCHRPGSCRWQRASPLDRQKVGSFWLPWTFVSILLQQLKARGLTSDAVSLEGVLVKHQSLLKSDTQAAVVDGQRQIAAL